MPSRPGSPTAASGKDEEVGDEENEALSPTSGGQPTNLSQTETSFSGAGSVKLHVKDKAGDSDDEDDDAQPRGERSRNNASYFCKFFAL